MSGDMLQVVDVEAPGGVDWVNVVENAKAQAGQKICHKARKKYVAAYNNLVDGYEEYRWWIGLVTKAVFVSRRDICDSASKKSYYKSLGEKCEAAVHEAVRELKRIYNTFDGGIKVKMNHLDGNSTRLMTGL